MTVAAKVKAAKVRGKVVASPLPAQAVDQEYGRFLEAIRNHFAGFAEGPLFTTDATGLWDAFLGGFPKTIRQHYNCHACRQFVERYGGLVAVSDAGKVVPVMWPDPGVLECPYKKPVEAALECLEGAKITGVFLTTDKRLGEPVTTKKGIYHHMAVKACRYGVHRLMKPGEAMAVMLEEYGMLNRALGDYPKAVVEQAVGILQAEALYRGEKVLGAARWLLDLQATLAGVRAKQAKENLTWRAVATAPTGFCHVRAGMIGTLLDDLKAGLPFEAVKQRFAAKMNPLQYQRPQAAPAAGNIANAEKIVEQLGIARSLERRFARLDEIQTIWRPAGENGKSSGNGVFAHLTPKGKRTAAKAEIPEMPITWVKFRETVLPDARAIEFFTLKERDSYCALVTAVHPDAPPILQWDTERQRNPVSWYVYASGSPAATWNLPFRQWCKVTSVAEQPNQWYGDFTHQGEAVVLILDGCRDQTEHVQACLFPEILKSDLHVVRATIEAFSRQAQMQGRDEASACGIRIQKGTSAHCRLRVTTNTTVASYVVDRWD